MMSSFTQNTACRVAAAALVLGLVACQAETPTTPESPRAPISFAIGGTTGSTPEFGKIKVCKSVSSNVSGDFTFTRSDVGASTGSALANATIAPNNCVIVAEDVGGTGVGSNVRINETSAGLASVTGQRIDDPGAVVSNQPFANNDELFLNQFHGYTITFTNTVIVPPPPPPSGNLGCSPGYWKNHAFPTGFTSTTTFFDVFGNTVYGTKTLLQVLNTGGGGLASLGRQTVSAFFNATVYADFGYTAAGVVSAFNGVVPGTSAAQTALKNTFEGLTDVDGRICTNPTGK